MFPQTFQQGKTTLLNKYSKSLSSLPLHHVVNPSPQNAASHPTLTSPSKDFGSDSMSEGGKEKDSITIHSREFANSSSINSSGATFSSSFNSLPSNQNVSLGDSGSIASSTKSPSVRSSINISHERAVGHVTSSSSSSHGESVSGIEFKETIQYRDPQSVYKNVIEISLPTEILKSIIMPQSNHAISIANVVPSQNLMNTFYHILYQYPQLTFKYILECAKKCTGKESPMMQEIKLHENIQNRFNDSNQNKLFSENVKGNGDNFQNFSQEHLIDEDNFESIQFGKPRIEILIRIFKFFLNVDVFTVVEPDIYFLIELDQFIHSGISEYHIHLAKLLSKLNAQIRILIEKKNQRDREIWKSYLDALGIEENVESWKEHIVTMKDVDPRPLKDSQEFYYPIMPLQRSFGRTPYIEKRRDLVQDFSVYRLSGRDSFDINDKKSDNSVRAFVTRKKSLLDSLMFGAQFRQIAKFEDKMPEIDLSDIIAMENVASNYRHISIVAEAKHREDSSDGTDLSSSGDIGLLSDNRDLNQSRVFEKIALDDSISLSNVDNILNILVDPEVNIHVYMEATHQLLHLLGDLFWSSDIKDIYQSQFFFLEMIQSPTEKIRSHTFDILYNLYLHLKTNSSQNSISKYYPILCEFHRNLTLHLLLDEESCPEVWKASHSCFLNLVGLSYSDVIQYDARILKKYIECFEYSDENQYRQLIQILINMIYFSKASSFSQQILEHTEDNPIAEMNFFILEQLGGIRYILNLYTNSHSIEVRNNLFVVIFDYVIHLVNQASMRSSKREHVQSLFQILVRANAPHYLWQIFKYTPIDFTSKFSKFIYTNLILVPSRQNEKLNQNEGLLDYKRLSLSRTFMSLIIRFSGHLNLISSHYLSFEKEFLIVCDDVFGQKTCTEFDVNNIIEQILSLLKSNQELEVRSGQLLLSQILEKLYIQKDNHEKKILFEKFSQFHLSLNREFDPKLQEIYLNVFERLIYFYRSQYTIQADEKFHPLLMKHINEGLLMFCSIKTHPVKLFLRAYYILMDFLSIHYTPPGNLRHPLQNEIPFALNLGPKEQDIDTISSMFLGGHIAIPSYLLKEISIGVLHRLFLRMTESLVMEIMPSTLERSIERARCVLFVLIIQKCNRKPSVLDSLGGISFFKNEMINDNNPGVAYFASEFLIKVLVREAKDEYYDFLKKIIQIAHKTNDAYLLDNPYLQLFKLITEGDELTQK